MSDAPARAAPAPAVRVYVDAPIHPYGRMVMCHMVAPWVEDLHAMADRIGVARRWFQDPRTMRVSAPHYDIAKVKRALAISYGAQEVDKYQMSAISKIALYQLPGLELTPRPDPLRILRARDGRPGHWELERVEAWLLDQVPELYRQSSDA
ncbi:DUF4031 domain-containing protein [Phenylobacterium ferrooxidans]|uniref:DUF4031 domain-containing protein n=1 Tax=Phenylobacterium ferrooxidans TaxID=2982689 RepID=A0ABW6CJ84_9CAUL